MTPQKSIPWPEGLDVAQMTFFAIPKEDSEFAPNVIVQLRTDAENLGPADLANRDLSQMRDRGTKMYSLDRFPLENDGMRVEYVFDSPEGEKRRQIVVYFRRSIGVYSISGTNTDTSDDILRSAIDSLVSVFSQGNN